MARRRQHRQPYSLDSGSITSLSNDDLEAVIRVVDDLVGSGGRTIIGKVLKGSQSKDVLELGLDKNPAYGYFKPLTLAAIGHRVDWVIEQGYLEVHYSGRLPCLSHSPKGLAIACRLRSDELFQTCVVMLESGDPYLLTFLKDYNRRTILQLLDRIANEKNVAFVPLLESWKKIEVKKVRRRIGSVIAELEGRAPKQRRVFTACLVDESVSQSEMLLFKKWSDQRGYFIDNYRWVQEEAPGIQDIAILDRMLGPQECLLSRDRILHNVALSKAHSSFYINDDDDVISQPLAGIKPRGIMASDQSISPKIIPLTSTSESSSSLPVVPISETRQKKQRTKRRRIRNYFGGTENMRLAAVTLSLKPARGGSLIGIRIRISAHSGGIKALDASENYIQEPGQIDPLAAYCHAFVVLLQLQLHTVPITFLHDTEFVPQPDRFLDNSSLADLYERLRNEFSEIAFTPSTKGHLIERLRRKLVDLTRRKTNEILESDLDRIIDRIECQSIP